MSQRPILEKNFYHDGRGPALQRVVFSDDGRTLVGFEYFNPDDTYEAEYLKHLRLIDVEAYSMAGEEVHGDIIASSENKAAIWMIEDSTWLPLLQKRYLAGCSHYQIMFYDEIFDVVCKEIVPGKGTLQTGPE